MLERTALLEEALHMLECALLIVDDRACIGFKNREAVRVLETCGSLKENERGCLTARPRALAAQVRRAIQAACLEARVTDCESPNRARRSGSGRSSRR